MEHNCLDNEFVLYCVNAKNLRPDSSLHGVKGLMAVYDLMSAGKSFEISKQSPGLAKCLELPRLVIRKNGRIAGVYNGNEEIKSYCNGLRGNE